MAMWSDYLTRWRDVTPDSQRNETPAATDAQVAEVERRLKIDLPPSYRAFLRASDGLEPFTAAVPRLRPAAEVDWLRAGEPAMVKAWSSADAHPPDERSTDEAYFAYAAARADFRPEHLRHALQISDVGDAAVYLLNPQVIDAAGEWEAWLLASWLPGVERHRSFAEMMLDQARAVIDVAGASIVAPRLGRRPKG